MRAHAASSGAHHAQFRHMIFLPRGVVCFARFCLILDLVAGEEILERLSTAEQGGSDELGP